ncbi:MAG: GtrA family protein [Clostridium perfringens]|nr:GtrA family protein [Clostridium perfringens]MDU7956431.1 GtrA family protein [Clostridium perfringens]MDU7963181.1 GtrA family protein [Clostridium perfringens]
MINIIQFLKFGIVGILNTLITVVSFNILIFVNINYLCANCISYFLGVINSYLLNSKFVFKESRSKENLTKFLIVNILVLGFNSLILYLGVNELGVNISISQIVSIVLGTFLNFGLNKVWVFTEIGKGA